MKLDLNLNLKAETAEGSKDNSGRLTAWMIALAITISLVICVCITVRVNVNYDWTNNPQIKRQANK